ncbi:hypothetical protein PSTG_03001 [Puccinia striiformis f. sp. tritici PST-78]|uniref:Uncharacterized protein n=1 Tax=Puccinia striiformis f. sp. tritici PST-78 TaxID=1165861 RepID=A0A0L0VX79_9BASI|nr:hypothetical protein PSTG_03001 [Puccinia striiformis f. sp. tritici PST-78]
MAIGPPDPTHGPAHGNMQASQAGQAGPNCPKMVPDLRPFNKQVAHGRPMGRLQIRPSGLFGGYPRAAAGAHGQRGGQSTVPHPCSGCTAAADPSAPKPPYGDGPPGAQ